MPFTPLDQSSFTPVDQSSFQPYQIQQKPKQSFMSTLGGFLLPQTIATGKQVLSGLQLRNQLPTLQRTQQQQFQTSQDLIRRAQRETDPYKKQQLLEASRRTDQMMAQGVNDVVGGAEKYLGIENGGQVATPLRQGIGLAGEAGAWLMPNLKVGSGLTKTSRILSSGATGAARGGLLGFTNPQGQGAFDIATRGILGTGFGGLMGLGIGAAQEGVRSLLGGGQSKLDQAIKQYQAEKPTEVPEKVVPNAGIKAYASQFRIGSKAAQDRLKPFETSQKMIEYGNTGTVDQIGYRAQVVNDQLTKMVNDATAQTGKYVDVGKAQSAAGGYRPPGVDPQDFNDIVMDLTRESTRYQQPQIGKINPLDALSLARYAQRKGMEQLSNNPLYKMPRSANEGAAKVYLSFFDEIMNQIDQTAKSSGALNLVKTPENMAVLEAISPKLAADVMKETTVQGLRHLMSPWVRMEQMVDLTRSAYASPIYNLAGQMLQQNPWMNVDLTKPASFLAPILQSQRVNTQGGALLSKLATGRAATGQAVNKAIASPGAEFLRRLFTIAPAQGVANAQSF